MFRDHRTAGAWLPKTMYTTRFQENGYHSLAEFDNDVDLTTGSAPGVVLAGENLSTWNENALNFRGGNDPQGHSAAWIGWNNRLAGSDKETPADKEVKTPEAGAPKDVKPAPKPQAAGDQKPEESKLKLGPPAAYTISVPAPLRSAWNVGPDSALYLSLAATNTKPGPRQPPKPPKKEGEEDKPADKPGEKPKATPKPKPTPKPTPTPAPKKKEEPDLTPVDLTVELTDDAGHVAKVPLSQYGVARHPLDARIYRRAGRDTTRFTNIYELIPQTFVMPLADFVKNAPDFNARQVKTIRLLFDKTEAGTIVLEHVGLSTPTDRAFLASPAGVVK